MQEWYYRDLNDAELSIAVASGLALAFMYYASVKAFAPQRASVLQALVFGALVFVVTVALMV